MIGHPVPQLPAPPAAVPVAPQADQVPHYYETTLLAAINTEDEGEACIIVERIHRYSMEYPEKPYPQLTTLMEGENFLIHAIRKNMPKLAELLLGMGEFKQRAMLLQNAKRNRPLISFCIDHDNLVTLRRLLQQITEIEQGKTEYSVWLSEDIDKYNPLHYAAQEAKSADYLQALLAWMEEGNYDPANLINAKNKDSDTPFHLLFANSLLPESIWALISYGADLDIPDENNLSSMDHLTSLDPDRQLFLLSELHRIAVLPGKVHSGQVLLENYRRYLISHPEHLVARSVYFRARALFGSLKDLLYAHHDLNAEVPLRKNVVTKRVMNRTDFFTCQDVTLEILLKAEYKYPLADVEIDVASHDDFKKSMPLYIKKLGLFCEPSIANIITLNKRTIDDISHSINQLLITWQTRRKKRAAAFFITIEGVLVLMFGIMKYLRSGYQPDFRAHYDGRRMPEYDSHCAKEYNSNPAHYCNRENVARFVILEEKSPLLYVNCIDEQIPAICDGFGTLFLYLAGMFVILVPIIMAANFFGNEDSPSFHINPREFQLVLDKVKRHILQPLSLVNAEVSPIYSEQLKKLNTALDALNGSVGYDKALQQFRDILAVLIQLRQEIEQKKSPFPHLKPGTFI